MKISLYTLKYYFTDLTPKLSDSKDPDPIATITNGSSAENKEPLTPPQLPSVQYSREEMLILEKTDLSLLRPEYLNIIFDR